MFHRQIQFLEFDYSSWEKIKPIQKAIGKNKRIVYTMPSGWTDTIAAKMKSDCQIIFIRHHVSITKNISIQAACGSTGCPVKYEINIPFPSFQTKVTATIKSHGIASHNDKIG